MSSDEPGSALPHHRGHRRKRSRSIQSTDPSASSAVVDSSSPSPNQIQTKRGRLISHNDINAGGPSVGSKSPTMIESAVCQINQYLENRLDKVKEDLRVWEKNGILSFSWTAASSLFSPFPHFNHFLCFSFPLSDFIRFFRFPFQCFF